MSGEQKVAVITGASQGIGAALVKAYRDRGYRVSADKRSIKPTNDDQVIAVAWRHRRALLSPMPNNSTVIAMPASEGLCHSLLMPACRRSLEHQEDRPRPNSQAPCWPENIRQQLSKTKPRRNSAGVRQQSEPCQLCGALLLPVRARPRACWSHRRSAGRSVRAKRGPGRVPGVNSDGAVGTCSRCAACAHSTRVEALDAPAAEFPDALPPAAPPPACATTKVLARDAIPGPSGRSHQICEDAFNLGHVVMPY